MKRRRRLSRAAPLLLPLLMAGCDAEPVTMSWEPIDISELEANLDMPTGELDEEAAYRINYIVGTTIDVVLVVEEVTSLIERALLGRARSEGGAFFLRVACPGDDVLHPVTDYSEGELHIELQANFDIAAARVTTAGHALVRATHCNVGAWQADGPSPGFIDVTDTAIYLDATFRLEGPGGGQLGFPVRAHGDSLEWQVFLDGDTYTVSLDREGLDYVDIRGANAVWRCSLDLVRDPCQAL